MKIGKTLYITNGAQWRSWLVKNHSKEKEIWLIYYKKSSNKPRISYNEAVEEALCYGWIDSIIKSIDHEKFAQRFTPRSPKSNISEMNKERIRRLIKQNKMKDAGLKAISHAFDRVKDAKEKFIVPSDILNALKKDKLAWKNFQNFSEGYKKVRIGYIGMRQQDKKEFNKRLNHFVKMTSKNKKFGHVL
jgi:uncharacterized protein YdeI (YjbR/CyaY-like superfamily)